MPSYASLAERENKNIKFWTHNRCIYSKKKQKELSFKTFRFQHYLLNCKTKPKNNIKNGSRQIWIRNYHK